MNRISILFIHAFVVCLVVCHVASAADIRLKTDETTRWKIYTIQQGDTVVKLVPDAGCNVMSLVVDGVEYFHQPEELAKLPGVSCGNPILYPTPNRVKKSKFTFRGREFVLDENENRNFIHGLVNRSSWTVVGMSVGANHASVTCRVSFREGTDEFAKFPLTHDFNMTVRVSDRAVRWTYEVDNSAGKDPIPFGVAFHPYFAYQGERADTYLTIPATHMMESTSQLLPTGTLIPAADLPHALKSPTPLKDSKFDTVFFGLTNNEPTVIDFRGANRKVALFASDEFTHLVVWTPDRGYFGVENQTCSTDAHNLASNGFEKEAHLQVCEPGQKMSGWVEYKIEQ
ncbi:MAG: aldose 1-epimerase [Planctomycetales bacterium]|nr:aldose 1-epimerase [Planctomycetales bacterium]